MIHPTDTTTLTAAASALRHAPEHMRTAHLADRLDEMAGRVREEAEKQAETVATPRVGA